MAIKRRTNIPPPDAQPVPVYVPEYIPRTHAKLLDIPDDDARAKKAYELYHGRNPKDVPIDDLVAMVRTTHDQDGMQRGYRNRIKGRISAIRAACVECSSGTRGVRMCTQITCPLWPFRMGNDPFRRKS